MALFWLARVAIQLFYYAAELRRDNRLADVAFILAALFLGSVFTAAAVGWRG